MVFNRSQRVWYTQEAPRIIRIKSLKGLGGSLKVNILLMGPLLIGHPIKAWCMSLAKPLLGDTDLNLNLNLT